MRTYYIAQGTLLDALWLPKREGNPKKEGNLYAEQEAIVRTTHGTTGWFKTGKGVCQVLSPY